LQRAVDRLLSLSRAAGLLGTSLAARTDEKESPMSSPHDVHVSYTDPAIDGGDPTLGHALERVFEAQQRLVVRRVDLLIEEITAKLRALLPLSLGAVAAAIAAFAGWFYAMAGAIDALDEHFPRPTVEIAIGVIHIAAAAVATRLLFRPRPRKPEVPS
jgi:hypothetical protein